MYKYQVVCVTHSKSLFLMIHHDRGELSFCLQHCFQFVDVLDGGSEDLDLKVGIRERQSDKETWNRKSERQRNRETGRQTHLRQSLARIGTSSSLDHLESLVDFAQTTTLSHCGCLPPVH